MSSGALLALLAFALLATMSRAQDTDTTWVWIMANSINSNPVCPGRCLAVNVSSTTDAYNNRPVGFVACKIVDDSSSSSSYSGSGIPASNNNQQWLYDHDLKEIQINATEGTDAQSTWQLLCLHPDPAKANRSLTLTTCNGQKTQKWIVKDNAIASLAFDPPRYLAMSYRLSGFLDPTDGTDGAIAWREATIVPSKTGNSSLTTTFSMVDGTLNHPSPQLLPGNEPPESRNFVSNGGFEQSSSDFSPLMSNLSLSLNDIFGLCDWKIIKTDGNLQVGLTPVATEGNRSLYLKDGIVKQTVTTSQRAFYALMFKVKVATPSNANPASGDQSDSCNGSDTLSVNPFPSTNVHTTVDGNGSWSTKHLSFQALGEKLELSLKGCAICGCFLDDLNLMQLIDHAPFPPPPPMPSPPPGPRYRPQRPDGELRRPDDLIRGLSSNRLSNWAVAGLVVGAAALFFVLGAAFFGVVCVKEKKKDETDMRRPPEWSIETTTPARSERERRSVVSSQSHANGSNGPSSAPQQHSSSTVGATPLSASQSSTNAQSGSGV